MIQEDAAAKKQNLEEIQNEVRKDLTMIRLVEYITRGWPKKGVDYKMILNVFGHSEKNYL